MTVALRPGAHTNISTLLREDANRLPEEDTVTLVEGFLGAYPNAFHEVDAKDLPAFVDAVASLQGETTGR
ncbi:MAG: fatty acid cis/trans isomerase [Candidatus Binatia bacterium]